MIADDQGTNNTIIDPNQGGLINQSDVRERGENIMAAQVQTVTPDMALAHSKEPTPPLTLEEYIDTLPTEVLEILYWYYGVGDIDKQGSKAGNTKVARPSELSNQLLKLTSEQRVLIMAELIKEGYDIGVKDAEEMTEEDRQAASKWLESLNDEELDAAIEWLKELVKDKEMDKTDREAVVAQISSLDDEVIIELMAHFIRQGYDFDKDGNMIDNRKLETASTQHQEPNTEQLESKAARPNMGAPSEQSKQA